MNLPIVLLRPNLADVCDGMQLNHLGGCYFDVSGGRCTDGCWLSTRVWQQPGKGPVLLVFLDFEGRWSREPASTRTRA